MNVIESELIKTAISLKDREKMTKVRRKNSIWGSSHTFGSA